MKTIAAILLLGILLFNWVGYRLVNEFMQDKANLQLEVQLDRRQYDESQLISIKVPLKHLSYYNSSTSFERVDGQIDIDGIPYQFVKRRIYHDSLEVLCIPNQTVLKLRISKDDYFKTVNDIQRSQQGQQQGSHPGSSKNFMTDPYTVTGSLQIGDRSFTVINRYYYFSEGIPSAPRSPQERPPADLA